MSPVKTRLSNFSCSTPVSSCLVPCFPSSGDLRLMVMYKDRTLGLTESVTLSSDSKDKLKSGARCRAFRNRDVTRLGLRLRLHLHHLLSGGTGMRVSFRLVSSRLPPPANYLPVLISFSLRSPCSAVTVIGRVEGARN